MTRLLPTLRAGALVVALAASAVAQQSVSQTGAPAAGAAGRDPLVKRSLTISDYARWRAIEGSTISGDGQWVAYGLRLTNVPATDSRPEVRIHRVDTGRDVTIADASQPVFSADSRWIAYQVEVQPPRGGRGGRGGAADSTTPVTAVPGVAPDTSAGRGRGAATPGPTRRLEIRELASGTTRSWQDMQNAVFSPTATHLIMRRRPAGGAGATPGAGGPGAPGSGAPSSAPSTAPRGTDALLHDLATGRSWFLGSVNEASFNRDGTLLAYTVEASVRDGNGLFLVDLATGRTHVLDNDARAYARLTWNDAGTAVAVLKGKEVTRKRERDNTLLVIPDVRVAAARTLDTTAAGFPRGFVISDRATLSWSDDDRRVFLGIIPQTATPDSARRRNADSVADVDVWRTQDERIQSLQMIRADADRNFTFRQAYDVASGRFVRLADSTLRDVEIAPDGRWAVGRDVRAYISDYERPRADIYRVDPATGERVLMLKGQLTSGHVFGISSQGRHFLYWKDNRHHAWDLDAMSARVLGAGAPSLVDMQFDHPGPRPSYGLSGYTADGSAVIANGRYDLWLLPLNGSAARNLTAGVGTRGEMQLRIARMDPPDPMAPRAARDGRLIDLARPVALSAYGQWTKRAGFYELADGRMRELVYEDASFSTPTRAAKADRYLFTRQTFIDFPDLRIAGKDLTAPRRISDANPQQAEFLWGRRVLFDFKGRDGVRLQGVLALPDDYKAGERRPMIVSFYEKNSQNLHRYSAPSFVTGMGQTPMEAVSRGYIAMMPDVHFRTGSSHSDMLDAVEAATRKVIEMGYADPRRIGVHGHSYGGEGAAFIGTRSKMFAAVGMGAGVTDLYTDFSQSWGWGYQVNSGSGANAFDYYLYGQGRWGFSPWDRPDVYRNESALTHAPSANAPFLIMHGTADPTVSFQEGLNFYQALRYNRKPAVLLAYPNEGHGLRGLANRRDLTVRYFEFFDHYLRGAPAPTWMTDGVPYLVKEAGR